MTGLSAPKVMAACRRQWWAPFKMMKGASYDKTIQPRPWREGKTGKPGFARGNAPLSPPAAVLLLKGSMSLDSQSSTTPYESSSFATPEGEVCSTLTLVLT